MISTKTPQLSQFLLVLVVIFVCSCKGAKVVSDGTIDSRLSAKSVIKAHYQNTFDFKTLSGKLKINFSNGDSSQGFGLNLRMEKDKAIWISSTPLPLVKAYITPNRVTFYNKLQNEYFDGDFSYLSTLLGTEIDFKMLQNLLLGEALLDLRSEKYELSITESTYQLKPRTAKELYKILFKVEPKNYKMAEQELAQPSEKRLLEIRYENYQKVDNQVVPNKINIRATTDDMDNKVTLEYRNMELNRKLNFPYKIPKGYKEIVLE